MKYKILFMVVLGCFRYAYSHNSFNPEQTSESPSASVRKAFNKLDETKRLTLLASLCEELTPEDQMKLSTRLFYQASGKDAVDESQKRSLRRLDKKTIREIASQLADMEAVLEFNTRRTLEEEAEEEVSASRQFQEYTRRRKGRSQHHNQFGSDPRQSHDADWSCTIF